MLNKYSEKHLFKRTKNGIINNPILFSFACSGEETPRYKYYIISTNIQKKSPRLHKGILYMIKRN